MLISNWGSDLCSSDLKPFPKDDRSGKFMVLASGYEADEGALKIGADARVLGATLKAGESLTYDTVQGSHAYLVRSEEHTSELQSLMRISYAVFCLKKKTQIYNRNHISND